MKPIRQVFSRTAVLPYDNVDTDRIIPARFLTTTGRDGLGRHCFSDWRYRPDGSDNPEFALNRLEARGCTILIAGHNFGCGSSREHAPWALLDFGIRAVLSSEIAEIFCSNSLKNGLLAIAIGKTEHRYLIEHPGIELNIDIVETRIKRSDGECFGFAMDAFARHCLLEGVDQLEFLLNHSGEIDTYERCIEASV